MFVERRQRVTGIDKSYPLQPISKSTPVNSTRQRVTAVGPKQTTFNYYMYINSGCNAMANGQHDIPLTGSSIRLFTDPILNSFFEIIMKHKILFRVYLHCIIHVHFSCHTANGTTNQNKQNQTKNHHHHQPKKASSMRTTHPNSNGDSRYANANQFTTKPFTSNSNQYNVSTSFSTLKHLYHKQTNVANCMPSADSIDHTTNGNTTTARFRVEYKRVVCIRTDGKQSNHIFTKYKLIQKAFWSHRKLSFAQNDIYLHVQRKSKPRHQHTENNIYVLFCPFSFH